MKKIDPNILVNWWLEKYHNTNLNKIFEENPKWKKKPDDYTREFYNKYKVTQEQYDEWELWAKQYVKKELKLTKALLDRYWWSIYLNTSPSVIKNN
jgi:hypothetical protein